MTGQVKSKKRVADHGEVFTAEREVNAMLDLVKQETERVDSRFLEMKAPKLIQIKYSSAAMPGGTVSAGGYISQVGSIPAVFVLWR